MTLIHSTKRNTPPDSHKAQTECVRIKGKIQKKKFDF